MKEKYLVINAGSSSLKFSLYELYNGKEIELISGLFEKIGKSDSSYTLKCLDNKIKKEKYIKNHTQAVEVMFEELVNYYFINDLSEIKGVGHRVLHGGEIYSESVIIDDEVMNNIKGLIPLGPLHIPGAISGIDSMKKVLNDVPQVAVFDTAYHQTMPKKNYLYAIPYEYYEKYKVRKYGFHGTSHKYMAEQSLEKYNAKNIISCHIGSGASICAIKDGKSYNTSMGLTPLDGLIMGTRSGSIDPAIIEYIANLKNLTASEVTNILNKKSGLLGLAGENDFRDLKALADKGDELAILAIEMFVESISDFIVKYIKDLEGYVDAIVFTAGIGENVAYIREKVLNKVGSTLNNITQKEVIKINKESNDNIARFKEYQEGMITTEDSLIKSYVIPTNEELMILKDTINLTNQRRLVLK